MKISLRELNQSKDSKIEIESTIEIENEETLSLFNAKKIDAVTFKGYIKSYGEEAKLLLDYEISMLKNCDRCLEDFSYELKGNMERIVSSNSDENFWHLCFEDDLLDLKHALIDEIAIAVPTQALCSESCQGLCSSCYVNLNLSNCKCEEENSLGSLGALATLLK